MKPEIKTETLTLPVSDGTEMAVFVARPTKESAAPGILVLQEAFGVNSHIRHIAARLAHEGYLAAAPELFHRTAPRGWEGSYTDFPSVMPHLQAATKETIELDLRATHSWLSKDRQADPSRMACIGFCMGGRASFIGNATLPLKAAISYYGNVPPEQLSLAQDHHGPFLMFWGGKDANIGLEKRTAVAEALRKARKPFVNVEFSEADHGFLCDDRKAFHPDAAKQAWALTLSFLATHV